MNQDFKQLPPLKERIESLRKEIDNLPDDDPDARCPDCDGYGNVITEYGAEYCHCVADDLYHGKLRALKENFNFAPWPPPFLNQIEVQDGFVQTPVSDAVRNFFDQWIENDHIFQCLILTGEHGRGKTLFPMALCRGFLHARKNATAIHFPWLVSVAKQGIDGNKTYGKEMHKISNSDLVFVDEPGWERTKGGEIVDPISQNIMVEIVQKVLHQRNLIISTNLSLEQLSEGGYLTTHTRDRLSHWAGKNGCVVDNGKSLRSIKLFKE